MVDDAGRVRTHPFVDALMPEAGGERRVTLVGYPGPSGNAGDVRLYTDPTFETYFEFPAAAVVQSRPSKTGDENSPTVVVVDAKTKVDTVTTARTSGDAAFLSGTISSSYYGAAAAFGAMGHAAAEGGTASYYTCAPTQNIGCTGAAAFDARPGALDLARTGTVSWECPSVNCLPTAGCAAAPMAHRPAPACICVATSVYASDVRLAAAPAAATPPTIAGCGTVNLTCGTAANCLAAPAALGCLNMMNTTVCTPTGVPYLCPAG